MKFLERCDLWIPWFKRIRQRSGIPKKSADPSRGEELLKKADEVLAEGNEALSRFQQQENQIEKLEEDDRNK